MRFKFKFSPNTEIVPNNQNFVNSYIHTICLKHNEYHDKQSNYCISRLLGGTVINNGKFVNYPNGGYLLITSLDYEFIDKIVNGISNNPDIGFGMKLIDIDEINENFYNGWNYFKTTSSGFILKRKNILNLNSIKKYYHTIEDSDINDVLKNHIINKFSKIDNTIDFSDLIVDIATNPPNKVINLLVKNVVCTSNVCQINIHTNKKLANLLYNYGIGQSTGSGFGTVYTTQFHKFYK